ncbi:MAG: type II toxin-antitoxin system HicA family toxin [Dehalococcoidia bacterium]
MPRYGPLSRADLIRGLRAAGFNGPRPGGKHQIMRRGDVTVSVPNPHQSDLSIRLVAGILRQAGINREEWERL